MSDQEQDARAPTEPGPVPGQNLAVLAEALYLCNLLLLPGLAFLALVLLYLKHRRQAPPLARCHLRQTLWASLWGGSVLVAVNVLILIAGGYQAAYTWVFVILYFTVCHTTLVMLGMLGLAKAMAGKPYRYPLIGIRCNE